MKLPESATIGKSDFWHASCTLWCVDKYLLWAFYDWRENVHKRQWTPKSSACALGSGQQNQFLTQHVFYMGCEDFEVMEGLRVVCYCINRQYILDDSWHIKNIRDVYFYHLEKDSQTPSFLWLLDFGL